MHYETPQKQNIEHICCECLCAHNIKHAGYAGRARSSKNPHNCQRHYHTKIHLYLLHSHMRRWGDSLMGKTSFACISQNTWTSRRRRRAKRTDEQWIHVCMCVLPHLRSLAQMLTDDWWLVGIGTDTMSANSNSNVLIRIHTIRCHWERRRPRIWNRSHTLAHHSYHS